jgi:ubiquitin carboxyl-terminal hydrolase 7
MIELMTPKYTFTQSEIRDGDIICFQVDIPDQEAHNLESQGLCSNPQQFYKSLQDQVMEPDKERGISC